ncbi:hypothetical protein [Alistipes sp. ZOR0009]|jgi:hypothetical protein|uniref:hypothetical protein n=1 Tax=Alistipes sp. ZOR0009 TaxID=1339253 RepID=UPI0006483032|nr:hypothetical protein [Alistipes sp. ZOR0009]
MRVFVFDEDVLKKLLIEATYRFLVFDDQSAYSLPLNYRLTATSRHFLANDVSSGQENKILKYSAIKRVVVDDKEFFIS